MSCDYLYLTKNGVFARNELSEDQQEASTRVLVMYCGAKQTPFANAVPHKGADADGYVVECVRQNVLWLGHYRVTIRSDNEPALLHVVSRAVAALKMSGAYNVVDLRGAVTRSQQTPHKPSFVFYSAFLFSDVLSILFLFCICSVSVYCIDRECICLCIGSGGEGAGVRYVVS